MLVKTQERMKYWTGREILTKTETYIFSALKFILHPGSCSCSGVRIKYRIQPGNDKNNRSYPILKHGKNKNSITDYAKSKYIVKIEYNLLSENGPRSMEVDVGEKYGFAGYR